MAVERFITENGSITLEQMEETIHPMRVYFVVAQEESPELSCEVQFAEEHGLGIASTLVCPYVTTIGGEHYYSSTYKPMVYLNLMGQGPGGEIPTPTPSPSATPSPSVTLDSGPQGPTGDGYIFLTKAELQTAVDEWASDSTSATETYGDISTWNVSAIEDMSELFKEKMNITTLDLGGWDTSNVTDMSFMFHYCDSLTSLDVSNFDTSNVTNMNGMFKRAEDLTSLTFGDNFDTSNVTDMSFMFATCYDLDSVNLSNFDTSNVANMNYVFYHCSALTSLDISGWCVTQIDYVPVGFSENAPFANDPSNLPNWGYCPVTGVISGATNIGDDTLNVSNSAEFTIGDQLVIDRGTSSEETTTIINKGSLVIYPALTKSHADTATVESRPALPSPTPSPSVTLTPVSEEPFDFAQLSDAYEELPTYAKQSVVLTGTIVEVNLEGGFKGIELDSGVKYVPLNIQNELLGIHVGKQISVSSGYIYPDHAGIQMWGTYLYVTDYEFVTAGEICFDDFGDVELAVTDADNQSTYINGISVTSSIAGKFRFKATHGAGGALPSVYLCELEDQSVQFKITSTAISFDTTFMFESANGSVYKGSLDKTTLQSGVNTFSHYSCDALFTAESVELRDIYSLSQPLYEGLDTDPLPGDHFVAIRFENFSINENSSFYDSAFASTSETTGTSNTGGTGGTGNTGGTGGYDMYGGYTPPGDGYGDGDGGGSGYSSHSYAIVVHKALQGVTDQMLLDSVEYLFDGRSDNHFAGGTPTVGKLDDTFELEVLTNDNLELNYLVENFRLEKHDIAGIVYARHATAPDLATGPADESIGSFNHVAFNSWKQTDDLVATFFLYSTSTNGSGQVNYQQTFKIDSISGSITSNINELEIPVDLNTGTTSQTSSVTVKPTASGLTGTYNLYYDDVLDITTPVVYLVSLRNNADNSDFEHGGLKITLTSDVVRPRIELVEGGNTYVGHLLYPVGTGMNYLDPVSS